MVICLERGANDLHMVQLMPLPSHHLLLQKNPEWRTFWCRLTELVLEKRLLNGCSSSSTGSNNNVKLLNNGKWTLNQRHTLYLVYTVPMFGMGHS